MMNRSIRAITRQARSLSLFLNSSTHISLPICGERVNYSLSSLRYHSFQKHAPVTNYSPESPLALEGKFHEVADDTLEELSDLVAPLESALDDFDLTVAQGVLTIKLGAQYQNKTWVINKQTPNRQIWWSSPVSGPRRYEYNSTEASSSEADRWRFTKDSSFNLRDSLKTEIETITAVKL